MEQLIFLNEQGDFLLRNAQRYPGVYFPLVNEGGMLSSVTPLLAGDCKTGQNTYLLAPASSETLHESRASRNFWVCAQGYAPWSVSGQSAPQQAGRFDQDAEETVLTGGLLWQKTARTHSKTGLLAEALSFVPAGQDRAEILQIRLKNNGSEPITLTPIAAIPMYGRSADNIRDHRHVTSLLHRVELTKYGLNLRPTLTFDERGHQPGNVTYRVWGAEEEGRPPVGFVPLVRDFVGQGSYDWPEAVIRRENAPLLHTGQTAQGGEVVAALYFDTVTLCPGQSRHYQIVLTVDDDPMPYLGTETVREALKRTKDFWQSAAAQTFRTQNGVFDAWMRWVGIQPTLRRICGCSFLPHHDYGRGGRGWRDLWQDSLALLLKDPESVREDLKRYFAGVRTDGTNATIIGTKAGEFKADRNNIPRVWMDHGFWPLITVALYLNETGDDGFLLERQPYFQDTLAFRGEGEPLPQPRKAYSGSVLEHLLIQTVTAFFDVGEHGFIRLRGADWNDGLDMARERGESVAFTAAYALNLKTLAEILARLRSKGMESVTIPAPLAKLLDQPYGEPAGMARALIRYCRAMEETEAKAAVSTAVLAEKLNQMGVYLCQRIRATEWVGDGADLHWFNSYYDNSGCQVEGTSADTVRMILTGQVFCLLSGTADENQVRQIIRAADWYLCDPARGGYCLNTDFHEVKQDLGRMFGFSYGSKENGAVFSHMAVMYAYALYCRGFTAEGWRVLEQLFQQSVDFTRSRILPGIPEYFDERGQGMYPYLTGAGSWLLLTLQTQVFGVRGSWGDLTLEPKLLSCHFGVDGIAQIQCVSAGRTVRVRYHNPHGLDWGAYRIAAVTCGEKIWLGGGKRLVIPRESLPENGTVTLDVTLEACE